jgi:NADPH-dependent curcumin reductase CurA
MPGVTAWMGMLDIARPQPWETVLVSAAAGAVGSIAGQLAKIRNCRVVGIAGGPRKCEYIVRDLGFDTAVDYKAGAIDDGIRDAAPQGIDVYFDNVGGEVLDAALGQLRPFARVVLCGFISEYERKEPYCMRNIDRLLASRVKLQGFIVSDQPERWPQALHALREWVASGRIVHRESVVEGLENAPRALVGLLNGENIGKQLVKIER